ncbi:uridine kinase, partial [Micromonospora sp. CV4]
MRIRPISPDLLVTELTGRLADDATRAATAAAGPARLRVAVDGAPAAGPDALA